MRRNVEFYLGGFCYISNRGAPRQTISRKTTTTAMSCAKCAITARDMLVDQDFVAAYFPSPEAYRAFVREALRS